MPREARPLCSVKQVLADLAVRTEKLPEFTTFNLDPHLESAILIFNILASLLSLRMRM
jgi:hypothetical protein